MLDYYNSVRWNVYIKLKVAAEGSEYTSKRGSSMWEVWTYHTGIDWSTVASYEAMQYRVTYV